MSSKPPMQTLLHSKISANMLSKILRLPTRQMLSFSLKVSCMLAQCGKTPCNAQLPDDTQLPLLYCNINQAISLPENLYAGCTRLRHYRLLMTNSSYPVLGRWFYYGIHSSLSICLILRCFYLMTLLCAFILIVCNPTIIHYICPVD